MNITKIAEKLGREVGFYLLANGDFRAVIDDRYGNNQGYFQENGGERITIDGSDLDAIALAKEHVTSNLVVAWRISAAEARATMREVEREADGEENPLAAPA